MSETGSRKSVIGAGATFTGKLVKANALDIHGEVNADISTDRLHLHEGARLAGNLEIKLGVFAGEYKGRMKAASVWMMRTARIFGEIEYIALQMDRGAALNCHIPLREIETDGLSGGSVGQRGSWILWDLRDLVHQARQTKEKAAFR